jgi:glycerol-3-phosphate cytidylyltransferase-like family protein
LHPHATVHTNITALQYVDEVVRDVPYIMDEEYLNYIFEEHKIDYVVHGDDPCIGDDTVHCVFTIFVYE